MGVDYIRSTPGLIKIVEEVLNIIAFSCVAGSSWTTSKADAFLAASIGAFIVTAILLIIRTLDIDNKIPAPWQKIEFGYCILWSIFYLVVAGLIIDQGDTFRHDTFIAGGCFGLFAICVYIFDAYDKWVHSLS